MDVSTEHQEYLNEHRFGVLSTGRKDGSPQASMVGVFFDGSDFLVTFRRGEREVPQHQPSTPRGAQRARRPSIPDHLRNR